MMAAMYKTSKLYILEYRKQDTMETLLISSVGGILENSKSSSVPEVMTPYTNYMVILHWLEAIGGLSLIEHVSQDFAKDFEMATLGSLQNKISRNINFLIPKTDEQQQFGQFNKTLQFHPFPNPWLLLPIPEVSIYCKLCRIYTRLNAGRQVPN